MTATNAFEAIRAELLNNDYIKKSFNDDIYFGHSPIGLNPDNLITLNYSELNGGSFARRYELKITIATVDFLHTAKTKECIIYTLDRFDNDYGIKNNVGSVQSIQLANGNEIIFNSNDNKYYTFLYFSVII